ncbi:SAM-dependent DNA methyltransferase [Martelella alba]|uniref:site-specific DNA-methyltransferase (adenine-specific) n=1 Tax=Martelella alba TaxID=2590451 RepID=A0A506U0T0_9HYPH|nr:class I SAM-dependent DNA methyltransferase [Martelella alba]TPW26565.1 SAM-dependent DNA methyltransferase [Martelella alba]
MSNVTGVIKSIQDIMRKDAGVDGDAQRIGQLVWMFFLKILDDQEESLMLLSDDYNSPIPDHLRWSAWATNPEGITGDALLDFINNQLFPKLKNLSLDGPERDRARVVRTAFEDAYNYMKNGTLIRQVVNKINEIDFNNTGDKHAFGDVYEQVLKDLQSAGNAGEFYTPRAVTQFMVGMLDPQLSEKVLDPACGTGGFLAHVMDHKTDCYVQSTSDAEIVQKTIFGVEKKALPHLLCVTNMMLHGIEAPTNILHDNTLATPLKDHKWRGTVDVIVTNPPFGGMEEDGIEKNVPQAFQTRETADLFLVLIIELLKDGGRAAVVLPDGTLFGEGIKTRIKEKLMTECNLHTIIRLPNGVFNPYTGIKTNLLFFEKCHKDGNGNALNPTSEVWFYEHPYPEGYKNYSKTKPMRIEEFRGANSEQAWWGDIKTRAERKENGRAWKVSAKEIKANGYNLDISNPHREEEGHKDPAELLAAWQENRKKLAATQEQLRGMLAQALTKSTAA